MSQPIPDASIYGLVYRDPDRDSHIRLAEAAAEVLAGCGIKAVVDRREPRGIGGGPGEIQAWVWLIFVGIGSGVVGGALNAAGADLWTAVKESRKRMRAQPPPLGRAGMTVELRTTAGEVRVSMGPDLGEEVVEQVVAEGFVPPADADVIDLRWDSTTNSWNASKVSGRDSHTDGQ